MKKKINKKIGLVLSIAIVCLFMATTFSGAISMSHDTITDSQEVNDESDLSAIKNSLLWDRDWNWWKNPPNMFAIPRGNIGIGTNNPTQKLEVNGTIKATMFIGDGSGLTGIDTGSFYLTASDFIYVDSHPWPLGIIVSVNTATGTIYLRICEEVGRYNHLDEPSQWRDWVNFGSPDANSTIESINVKLSYPTVFAAHAQMVLRMSSGEIFVRICEEVGRYNHLDEPSQWRDWANFGNPEI